MIIKFEKYHHKEGERAIGLAITFEWKSTVPCCDVIGKRCLENFYDLNNDGKLMDGCKPDIIPVNFCPNCGAKVKYECLGEFDVNKIKEVVTETKTRYEYIKRVTGLKEKDLME